MPMNATKVRSAWVIVGSIAAVVTLGFGMVQAIGFVAREQSTVRQSFPGAGLSLVEVTSDSGSIRVVGDDEESVRVVIRLEEGWSRIERVARVDGDRLVLSAACPVFSGPFCSATYEVHVPRRLDVVARSENADVGASDVDGAVTAGSSNGDVTGTRLGGEAQLTTDNGSVEGVDLTSDDVVGSSSNGDVELEMARAPRSVRAESDNGDVVVIVPRGSELYAVDATTDNGDAVTPIRTDPSARRRIVARSDNGDVTVRYP